ncbi:UvrD-helicase domain-containing protein [Mariprofundus sp. NF]|uniref:UvrD-helicase domain-containing protein n=1 Tax=Mariprofundus sp. NF TaxID=2608716 RepID=UPI001F505A46|nr:ATP-dependent helicase [Mariprofundus sp. NF]
MWNDSDLNDEQVEAIEEEKSVFLVACPGSGKTRTLTYKIARELSKLKEEKKWVVAITYTHRAADEIHERIEMLGVDTSKLWIGTIHSFCLEWILKPYGIYHDSLKYGFRVINSHDTEQKITELCLPFRNPKITVWNCGHHYTSTERVLTCSAVQRPYVENILDQYCANLHDNQQVDFEQILLFAYELIVQHSSISKLLSSLFSYILVDEYQDTKEIQYRIVAEIIKAGQGRVKSFIVGDPNQAIYGSLGGYAITAREFQAMANIEQREMSLSLNYRSSNRIVEYFSHYNVYDTSISAEGEFSDFPSVITFDTLTEKSELVEMLTQLIRHQIEVEGVPQNEICILAPQWIFLASMTRSLMTALPEYSFDGPGMVPFTRDIDNFWYKLTRIILSEPSPTMYVRRLRWAGEVLSSLEDANVDISSISRRMLLRECNTIMLAEQDGLEYLEQFMDQLFERLNIDYSDFPSLVEHHDAFFSSSRARIQRIQKEGTTFINTIDAFRKVFESRSGITVSTIHGIKGGEFDVVIAYALLQGLVPYSGNSNDSAKKLLYVIGSRARKHLHLISERGRRDAYTRTERIPTEVLNACSFDYDGERP